MLNHTSLNSQLNDLVAAPHWYVGYSGGVDSTVLLHLLYHWCAANSAAPPLTAIHVNHGLQAAAASWQSSCERVCHSLELPFVARRVEVSTAGSGEAAARNVRYQVFNEQMQPGAVLFLGHHLDDQVETFFLRLMRGAGVEGLAAIPRKRSLAKGLLVRPLLDYGRDEIEQYAELKDLAYLQDPSNADTSIDRNFLRAQVLPLLASRWPAYRKSVARASGHMATASTARAQQIGVPATVYSVMGDPGLVWQELLAGGKDVAAASLRAWLRAAQYQAPDQAAVNEFLRQLRVAGAAANPRLDCGAYCLQRYRDAVYRVPMFDHLPPAGPVALAVGERLKVPGVGTVSLRQSTGAGWRLKPGEQLAVSWRRPGERCRLRGRPRSSSFKKLLQVWGVPPWWRNRIPLLYWQSELLAVADLAQCESSRWCEVPRARERLWNLHWERAIHTL